MKANLGGIWVSGAALSAMLFLTIGCKENATLGWPLIAQIAPSGTSQASPAPSPTEPDKTPSQNPSPAPEEAPSAPPAVAPSGEMPLPPTNRAALAPARLPAAPEHIDLSPGLAEIIKMAQAGISEEVMLSYITNSSNVYRLTSNEIVYLNDMGISTPVITALIEKDNSPEAAQRKKQEVAASPLPPGAALTAPATNLYPATAPKSEIVQVPSYPSNVDYGIPYSQLPAATETALPENVTAYAPEEGQEAPAEVSYFYSSLSPYGNWYYVPTYGYCWRPTVSVVNYNWRPYCDGGRWLWSNHGWYWYSDYTWGWAPFHYGRWAPYSGLGWIWVPDTIWGPSWVSWRSTRYYCGWAPLPPRCSYVSGFGLYYNGGSVGFSFGFGYGYQYYSFLPYHRFTSYAPYHYYASRKDCRTIYDQSTVINNYIQGDNNTIINQGVGYDRVASVTRSAIPTVDVRQTQANFDAQGRRERLISNGDAVSVTRPAPPPAATTSAGMRSRNTSARLAPDRSVAPGQNATGSSASPPVPAEARSARPAARPMTPNRRDIESPANGQAARSEAPPASPNQTASSGGSSQLPPAADLVGQVSRGRSSRAPSEASPRGNSISRSTTTREPIIINRGNVFEGSMATPRRSDPSSPAPIIITRPGSRSDTTSRGMVVRTIPNNSPPSDAMVPPSMQSRGARGLSSRGSANSRIPSAQTDVGRVAPFSSGPTPSSRNFSATPDRSSSRFAPSQFNPGPSPTPSSRAVPRSSSPRLAPAPSPSFSNPSSTGMRSRSVAPSVSPSRPAPPPSRTPPPSAPSVSRGTPRSQPPPSSAPAPSSRGSRSSTPPGGGSRNRR